MRIQVVKNGPQNKNKVKKFIDVLDVLFFGLNASPKAKSFSWSPSYKFV